jgi:hypothetical protein
MMKKMLSSLLVAADFSRLNLSALRSVEKLFPEQFQFSPEKANLLLGVIRDRQEDLLSGKMTLGQIIWIMYPSDGAEYLLAEERQELEELMCFSEFDGKRIDLRKYFLEDEQLPRRTPSRAAIPIVRQSHRREKQRHQPLPAPKTNSKKEQGRRSG